ncbi:MAG: glycosyltransferase family 2 protein [Nitrospirota bacterium]
MGLLSACVITFNNERTVEQCLASLAFADEIIVLDSFSTDRTVEIARAHATRFEQQPFKGFRDQYNDCISMARYDWLLYLDADEVIPDEVRGAIRRVIDTGGRAGVAGYRIYRHTWFMGRWIRHGAWARDSEIRLVRRGQGRFMGGLHAALHIDGSEATLPGVIDHYGFADLADLQAKHNHYSTLAAQEAYAAGWPVSWRRMFGNSCYRFLRGYLVQCGFRDGLPGLIVAANAAWYVFLREAKLWELYRRKGQS